MISLPASRTGPAPYKALSFSLIENDFVFVSGSFAGCSDFVAFSYRGGSGLIADIFCIQAVFCGINNLLVSLPAFFVIFAVLGMCGDRNFKGKIFLEIFGLLVL
jgi:hypothetical protein